MESILDTVIQTARNTLILIHNIAAQFGYDLSTNNIAATVVSFIALYFAIITIYRTVSYAIRTAFWVAKWMVILYILAGSVGFLLSGQFSLAPIFSLAFASLLKLAGWGALPQVNLAPDGGIRVNGVPLEIPSDYHQYGTAWNKFRSRSATAGKSSKKGKKRGGIFDRFSDNKKQKEGASVLDRFLDGEFDAADAIQSVEAIQKGVADSFEAVRKAVMGEDLPLEQESSWSSWWPFGADSSASSRSGTKGGTNSR